MQNQFLIKRPIVTEKSTALADKRHFVFLVDKTAVSSEIKKLLKSIYKVDAIKINIINVKARYGHYGRAITVRRQPYKKAIITLKEGQTIDVMPQ